MKTFIKKIAVLILFMGVVSCEDDSELTVLPSTATTGNAQLSANNLVLSSSEEDDVALTINFNEPEFGYNAGSIAYQLQFDLAGGDFSGAEILGGGTDFSVNLTGKDVNKILLNLGGVPDTAMELWVRIETVLSSDSSLFSEPVPLTATPYASILDLSSQWGLVGSATINGWDGPDMPFYQTGTANEFVAYVTLIDGLIKVRADNDWTINYGDNELDGILDAGGGDISVTAGTYRIIFNSATLAYSIEEYSWGIVGTSTPNGFDGPDVPLQYDPFSNQWRAVVPLGAGVIKFRANNDWVENYGDNEPDGVMDAGGNDIQVSAGNYIITVNFEELTYSLEPIDNIWGLVGSAFNDWGATPDAKFDPDWSTLNDVWVLNNVTLLDGQFKIRANNAWTIEYGDNEPDGVLDLGGSNINITAGVYTITIDFTDPSSPSYIIQ